MKEFWDQRYAAEAYAYGERPNVYLAEMLAGLKPGRILFPAEGEGRNAVYAARLGWEVTAFDISAEGRKKALALATKQQVSIDYRVGDIGSIHAEAPFDAIALIYAHFPPDLRAEYHRQLIGKLRPGGVLLLEGFSLANLPLSNADPAIGGPKDPAMLYTKAMLEADFNELSLAIEERSETLQEGLYHNGEAAVLRMVARKPEA